MSKEKTEYEKLLDRLTPEQREELETSRKEALEEPPGFFEYIEDLKKSTKKD
ncbi:hypothetical protein [Bacillus cereus]|uniref:hypothetical protein n=1 Tax=Bacillus cereus TaxID=1396 RepID=UPI00027C082A|nr:hypothetical protein [Bacillus cereus]EJV54867.1 hypothetical protein IEM_05814 [Bacillus cereus BAG6O-2]